MIKDKDAIFYIQLNISAADFHHYYAQNVNSVITTSHTGETIRFPANVLQPFVSHSGVYGKFKITIDSNAKFKSIERVS